MPYLAVKRLRPDLTACSSLAIIVVVLPAAPLRALPGALLLAVRGAGVVHAARVPRLRGAPASLPAAARHFVTSRRTIPQYVSLQYFFVIE